MSNYWKRKQEELEREMKSPSQSYWDWKRGELEEEKKQKENDDDIAPVKTTKEEKDGGLFDFFQKGAFEGFDFGKRFDDGYQFGDIIKTAVDIRKANDQVLLGTVADAGLHAVKGITGIGEGIGDAISYGMAFAADKMGEESFARGVREKAKENLFDNMFKPAEEYLDQYSIFGKTSEAILQGIGQVGTVMATGGVGAAAGLGSAGVTALTTGIMGVSGTGSGMSEAYQGGANDLQALMAGLNSGAADAVSELIFGGLGKSLNALGFSKGLSSADDMLAKLASSKLKNQTAKNIVEFGIKAGAEGLEEVIAGVAQAYGKYKNYLKDQGMDFADVLKDENLLEQFVVGALTSGVAQAPGLNIANKTKTDFITGMSQNDQAVVKKEVEDRIAELEKDGKKLTDKEKADIEAQVEEALERGEISLDTIEEVLGGEDFAALQDTVQKENDALAELAELYEGEELQKHAETLLKDSKRGEIQKKLRESVFNLVKDSKLGESYREDARHKSRYEADVTKYSEKERAIVMKAMDSGVLNNSRRTHEFVDFVAKVSSYSGIDFEFTDNKKLRETGFVFGNATTNGFYDPNSNKVVINSQSKKYLHSLVGHEVTHALEGSGLYESIEEIAFEYSKQTKEYKDRLKAAYDMYHGKEGYTGQEGMKKIKKEAVADIIGDYLFSDTKFVSHLSVSNPNIFKRIYNEVKHLWKLATAGSQQAKQLEQLKYTFEKALREAGDASTTTEGDADVRYSIRQEAPPKKTKKAYKLMRLVDGKLYPLFIGNNEEVTPGVWYNADSPNLSQLKDLEPGTHLVDMKTGEAMTWDEYAEKYVPKKDGKPSRNKPNKDDVHWANDNGYRFMYIEDKAGGKSEGRMLKQYGDTRAYYNWGINGSSKNQSGEGSASLYALRPGWHFGEVPSMHQIGYGGDAGDTVRLDNQVWVEVEMSADVDYNAEAEANWGGDIPTHIPTDGYYKFATNPTQKKTKKGNTTNDATKADWFVAGAFKVNRILSDVEADSVVNEYNRKTGRNVPLDYRRNGGRVFNAETMQVEDGVQYSLSPQQEEFFKDSVVRDENGNLKVMYHGTSSGGHTMFDPYGKARYGLFGAGSYFTDSKEVAESYTRKGKGTSPQVYETYLNIKNPMDMDAQADPAQWKKAFPDAMFPDSGTNEQFYRAMEEYFEDEQYPRWEAAEEAMMAIEDMGYDGITHIGGGRYGKNDNTRHRVYIAFQPEQIKDVGNVSPTSDPDIRYSLSNDTTFTPSEIQAIQSIGRKSINSFTSQDIAAAEKFARKYWEEMGTKSPFYRAWFGDWRANETTPVQIATKQGDARGVQKNTDTGWNIQVSGKVFNETRAHTESYNTSARKYLPYINDIVAKAVLLDSAGVDVSKPKSENSLLMHSMYAVADIGNGPEVLKLYVEEINNPNDTDTTKRSYQLQNVEKYRPTGKSSQKTASSISPVAGTAVTVADLFAYVKHKDASFNPGESSKIVNADGTPKVMYHGSPEQFTVFDKRKAKSSGMYGRGFYFTDSASHAGTYGEPYKVYLNIRNPLQSGGKLVSRSQVRSYIEAVAENEDYSIENYGTYDVDTILDRVMGNARNADAFKIIQDINITAIGDMVEAAELFNQVNGTTFDGIVVPTETVAFYPEQIKSATDNIGTFDKSNPDIRFSLSEETKYDSMSYAEISEEQQKLHQRKMKLEERKREAGNNPALLQAMDDYSNLFTEVRGLLSKKRNGTATPLEIARIEEIKALKEEYLQRVADLQESLGLNAIAKEETEIRETSEALRVASDAAWAREGAEKENKAIEKSGLSAPDYFRKKALKAFKTTINFNEAGYLLPDGKMLNFSGGERNHRYRDHREIGEIYEATQGAAALNRFLNDGNIRVMAESPGIDLAAGVEPTKEQYLAIRRFINANGVKDGQFFVDFSDTDGRRAGNYAYQDRVNADKIISDIKHFYATGKIREQSLIDRFHHSLSGNGKPYGNLRLTGEDIRYNPDGRRSKYDLPALKDIAPVREEVAPVPEVAISETETTTETPVVPVAEDLFPDDLAPVQQELSTLLDRREALEEQMLEAGGREDFDTFYTLNQEYEAVNARIEELDSEVRAGEDERLASLDDADAPPERTDTNDRLESDTPNPMAGRPRSGDDFKKAKSFTADRPEVKTFFQDEARGMLGDLGETIRGERFYSEEAFMRGGNEIAWTGTSRQTAPDIAELLDSYHYSYDQIEKALNAIIEDRVTERHLAAKNIEFMLNNRMLYGYTDVWGRPMPANQEYIQLAQEMAANDARQGSFDSYMESIEDSMPPETGDIGPVPMAPTETVNTDSMKGVVKGQESYITMEDKLKSRQPQQGVDDIGPLFDATGKGVPEGQQAFLEPDAIAKRLARSKELLMEEYLRKRAEKQSAVKDKNAFISNRATELYQELRGLKKGVKASESLGYLLDHGYEWSAVRAALVNIRHTPDRTVNQNSAIENIAREMLATDYEDRIYELDEMEAEYQRNVEQLEADAEKERTGEGVEKRTSRKQLHENIVNGIKADFSGKGLDLDKVLDSAKRMHTISINDNTPQRVNDKTFGYEAGEALNELTFNRQALHVSEGVKWENEAVAKVREISKRYCIKPGSKKSAAAQMYAEGFYVNEKNEIISYGDRELAIDFPDPVTQAQIKGLARDKTVRKIYDDTLKAINESRTRNAYPEIPRLDNYYLHMRMQNDAFSRLGIPFNPNDIKLKDLPTDINGMTADRKPGQPYFSSAMHREGKRTDFDLLGGLEKYIHSAMPQIYLIDDIQTERALWTYIANRYGQAHGLENLDDLTPEEQAKRIEEVYSGHLSNYAKFLNEHANHLAGKTALMDRTAEGLIGRRGLQILHTINQQSGRNQVGYNVSSAGTNFIPMMETIARTPKQDCIKAFAQTVSNIFRKDGFVENDPALIRRKGADRFHKTLWEKLSDPGYILMGTVDNVTSEFIVRAKYNEYVRGGMDSEHAHIKAGQWAMRVMGDRSTGQMPLLYNSKTLGILTKYQLEVRNTLDSMFYDTIKETKASEQEVEEGLAKNAKIAWKATWKIAQIAALNHAFGATYEKIAGYNPAFDIISVIATLFGFDDDDEDEDTFGDNLEQAFQELLGDLPYTSLVTDGGRIPMSDAFPIKKLLTNQDEYGQPVAEGPWGWFTGRLETAVKALPYALPGGYGQLKKTIQGLDMFSDDHPIAGSYTDSGNLRFPVEDTFGNRVQAALFGQWASSNARDYFDNERRALTPKQTQELIDVGISIQDYWKYREGLSGLGTLEQKLLYIDSLNLTTDQKNVLANNLTDRKEPIDMTDYDQFDSLAEFDYANDNPEKYAFFGKIGITYEQYKNADDDAKEAYDWAFKYPGKYQVSKAVSDDYLTFWQYKQDISKLDAKDENGETINGLKKERVIDYINNLDMDYGQRIILYRSMYNSQADRDDYNSDILDYLNSRDDLTYEEKVSILKELDFTVTESGDVYWE